MAITQQQLDALKKFIHPATIYTNVAKPNPYTPLALHFGVPAGASGGGANSVGMTSGATSFEYKPEYDGADIEQAANKVAPRIKGESLQTKFKCAEPTAERLRLALGSAGNYVETLASGAIADPTTQAPATVQASGGLPAGEYYLGYTFKTAHGETRLSPLKKLTVPANGEVDVDDIPLPTGAIDATVYMSDGPNSYTLVSYGSASGGTGLIELPSPVFAPIYPPTANRTAGGGTPGTQTLFVGGNLEVATQCIALVSKIGSFTVSSTVYNLYSWVCIYEAISGEGLHLEWKRAENQMIEVTIIGWSDPTRDDGDNLVQVGQLTAP